MSGANRMRFRNATAAEWEALNPILLQGEPGFEEDTGKLKVGDGATPWNALDYATQVGPTGPTGATGPMGPTGASLVPPPTGAGQVAVSNDLLEYETPLFSDVHASVGGVVVVEFGSDITTPRPAGAAMVIWYGLGQPQNMVAPDFVVRLDEIA